jgi:hypothetical protein
MFEQKFHLSPFNIGDHTMRDTLNKIAKVATLGLALASTATAQTYTRIDNFASGSGTAITGEKWYNFVVQQGRAGAAISNEGEVINPEGYAEIRVKCIVIETWNDWAQATIGLKAENNGVSYDFAQCDGFRYKYLGPEHRFSLQSEKDGLSVAHYKDIPDDDNFTWTTVTVSKSSFSRDSYDEAYSSYKDIPLDLSKVNDIHWSVRPNGRDIDLPQSLRSYEDYRNTGYCRNQSNLRIKDFECIGDLDVSNVTPIRLSQTTGKWNILAHTASNAIVLQNLPKNAKIQAYNLQGKQIYSANPENPKILTIGVQAKGMYIVKISYGSETKTLRMAVK